MAVAVAIYIVTDDPIHTRVTIFAWIPLHIGTLIAFLTRDAMKECEIGVKQLWLFWRH
jgi:hypothetical protein